MQEALTVLKRLVAAEPQLDVLAEAHLRLGLLHLHVLGRPTTAYQHLLTVLDLDPPAAVAEAARFGLSQIKGRRGPLVH